MKFSDYLKERERPKLKLVEKKIYEVRYLDLDKFVKSIWGGDYEFVEIQEANNGTCYSFKADGKISEYENSKVEKIKLGKYTTYCNHLIFNLLVKEGYLEPGEYVVDVFW